MERKTKANYSVAAFYFLHLWPISQGRSSIHRSDIREMEYQFTQEHSNLLNSFPGIELSGSGSMPRGDIVNW